MKHQELIENEDYMVLNKKSNKISRYTFKKTTTDKLGTTLYVFFDHDSNNEITVGLKWLKRAFKTEERCLLYRHLNTKRKIQNQIEQKENELNTIKQELINEIRDNGYIVDYFPEKFI